MVVSQVDLKGLNLRGMDFDLNAGFINYSKYGLDNLLKLFEFYCPRLQSWG